MAVGRISGPLLKDNLLRNGVNLAFETNLLYLDVNNGRIGIKTSSPAYDLDVNGTTRTTNLTATTQANLATFTISGNNIASSSNTINFLPSGAGNTIYNARALVGNLQLTGNTISTTNSNGSINITANGTGGINLGNSSGNVLVTVTGDLHATGNITADGNITLGDNLTQDTVSFSAEINSDIIPKTDNTYNLGSSVLTWSTVYTNSITVTTVSTTNFTATGILSVSGASTLSGNTTIGATSSNTLTVIARINSDLVPSANNTYNLGSSSGPLYWNNGYISTINTAGMQITSNSITATVTNSNLQLSANGTGTVYIPTSNLNVTSNASVGGTLTVTGTSTLAAVGITGTLTQTGNFTQSSGNFSTTGTINSGAITSLGTLTLPNVTIANSTITGTTTATNLILTPYAGQQVEITSNATLDGNATVGGTLTVTGTSTLAAVGITGNVTQTGTFNQTGNFTTTGTLFVSGNLTASSIFTVGNIQISGNTVTTTNTNGNLNLTANGSGSVNVQNLNINNNIISSANSNANIVLTPQGTGNVVINNNQSFIVPVGTTGQQPASPANGMVRYNTTNNRYEGYANGYWTNLGGVQSLDGRTYIIPESSPGANNNVISFYANNVNSAYINSSGLYATDFKTANIDITGNTISTYTANTDINLVPNGTGSIAIGNLAFNNNAITNRVSQAVTVLAASGAGYYKFGGTYGVGIPFGNGNTDRPGNIYAETGMIRLNTDSLSVEVFNGAAWSSVVGNAGGITNIQATDIALGIVLSLG